MVCSSFPLTKFSYRLISPDQKGAPSTEFISATLPPDLQEIGQARIVTVAAFSLTL